jgi:hypothetical protein
MLGITGRGNVSRREGAAPPLAFGGDETKGKALEELEAAGLGGWWLLLGRGWRRR